MLGQDLADHPGREVQTVIPYPSRAKEAEHISKNDIPYMFSGWWLRVVVAANIAVAAAMFLFSDTRPMLLEMSVGCISALVPGRFLGARLVAYVQEVATEARHNRLLLLVPQLSTCGIGTYVASAALVFLLLPLPASIVYVVWARFPTLSAPWTSFAVSDQQDIPFASMGIACGIYILATVLLATMRLLRWYHHLPTATPEA